MVLRSQHPRPLGFHSGACKLTHYPLTTFFDENCAMLSPGPNSFPAMTDRSSITNPYNTEPTMLAALEGAGLVVRKAVHPTVVEFFHPLDPVEYSLTAKGQALFKAPGSMGPISPAGFCAGHIRVVAVDRFTEPVDQDGRRVSTVSATIRAEYDDWTNSPALRAAFPQLGNTTSANMQFPLVLTNDGWTVAAQ